MTRPFSAEHELGSWIGETRVVAAMDIGVAVEATPTLRVVDTALSPRVRTKERWRLTLSHQLRQIPAVRRMAGVAQERWPHFQHAVGDGAMRVMANGAVFGNRLVVVDERSAFLGMALVAGLDHAVSFHELWSDRAMRIVAIRTSDLAFEDRMTEGPLDFRALLLVAREADLGLGDLGEHLVSAGAMHGMAGGTDDIAGLVRAAFPVVALAVALVAGEAGFGALGSGHRLATRVLDPADAPATTRFHVLGRITMAGRTFAGIGRPVQISLLAMNRVGVSDDSGFVTSGTDFRAGSGCISVAKTSEADNEPADTDCCQTFKPMGKHHCNPLRALDTACPGRSRHPTRPKR